MRFLTLDKPYVFGHRGAMGYRIENTLESFKCSVKLGAGIESDIQQTMDKKLVCLHDASFKIQKKWYNVRKLTYEELTKIPFKDGREIPLLKEIFNHFSYCNHNLRYSFDIGNVRIGKRVIDLCEKFNLVENVEITDTRPKNLFKLRDYNNKSKLVHTIPYNIINIDKNTIDFDILHDQNISTLNIKMERANKKNFSNIIDNGFDCYIWGVDFKSRMRRVLKLRYKDQFPKAVYSNYPDKVIKMRDTFFD